MTRRPLPTGHTLPELLGALLLVAVLAALAVPGLRYLEGAVAARAARDALVGVFARARAIAAARGGATVVLDQAARRVWIEDDRGAGSALELGEGFGVTLAVDGRADDPVRLRFDGLGIGRVTSRTVRLRRSGAEARVTLSSYGRVRVW